MQNFTLNNGLEIPALGLGVFQMNDEEVARAIPAALEQGYRLIDTASRYYNEEAVGKAIKASGVDRGDIFLTTKLWFKDHGYEAAKQAFETSLRKLDTDYLDLYLIHQPFGDYYGAYRAMEELYAEGKIKALGVSNFYPDRYLDLVHHFDVVPAVNQREIHPFNQQKRMLEISTEKGTLLQAWGAIGQGNKEILTAPAIVAAAEAHGKSVAQVMLRWHLQRGVAAVAKSTHAERLAENIDIFDFELTGEEMAAIAALDRQQPNAGFDHRDPRMFQALLRFE
ncbi:aldo/keto reductase [Corynebacterium vitaeruminis]|uniref:Glyoxal reductase n=1 Tax=Corynebacterium vitaeruminis DSM 20294 TaxID=1224164 RepID=W5Y2Q0_9CORY|nr:aldo/keto reductase [Corynebacterium vitaeruminis]AHI23526.1 glyoxal reductase [Corynebacterium vitaeruminis DSM 20294]